MINVVRNISRQRKQLCDAEDSQLYLIKGRISDCHAFVKHMGHLIFVVFFPLVFNSQYTRYQMTILYKIWTLWLWLYYVAILMCVNYYLPSLRKFIPCWNNCWCVSFLAFFGIVFWNISQRPKSGEIMCWPCGTITNNSVESPWLSN